MGYRKSKAFLMSFVLTSCAHVDPVAYECPKIVLPADPISHVHALTDKSKPDDVMKAWVATALEYKSWNEIVRKQIEMSK